MTFTIKIYKLTNTINNSFYVGSTKLRLCQRMGKHRDNCRIGKPSRLYRMMQAVGVGHWQITLIEAFEVGSFEEQRQREREVMERVNPDLNERYAYRSPEQEKQYNAAYNAAYGPANYQRNRSRHKCECCRIATHSKVNHDRHMQTAKHQRNEAASLFRELPFY